MSAQLTLTDGEMEALRKATSRALDTLINDPDYWANGELDVLANAYAKLSRGLNRPSRRRGAR